MASSIKIGEEYLYQTGTSTSTSSISVGSASTSFTAALTTNQKRYSMMSVYQAGPMDNCTEVEIHGWRDMLKRKYPDINWLDPSFRTYQNPVEEWRDLVEADLKEIWNSDALLAYVWRTSSGTAMELVHAKCILKIPVVVVVDNLSTVGPWIQYHSDLLTDSFDKAYDFLIKMAA